MSEIALSKSWPFLLLFSTFLQLLPPKLQFSKILIFNVLHIHKCITFVPKTNDMNSIQLTSKDNNEVFINLEKVAAFTQNGRGTRILYVNGQTLDVKESLRKVEHLLDHCMLDVSFD